ncbi:MAG: hypothetical protein PHU14_10625, partial [Methylovulum sp.]|nr:hypothetical protein [Methylovulum sp.]
TRLAAVDCAYVYLKADKSERQPPSGDFKALEFSKLYQEIAGTVDFIAHNPDELQALLAAIERLKANDADIFVQQIERKQDSVVVKVKAPEEFDKQEIYRQVKEEFDNQLKQLAHEHQQKLLMQECDYLKRENMLKDKNQDLLADLLKTVAKPPTIINENTMTDNSRHQSITNSPISQSAVNLGDNSTVSNSVQQLPESHGELKALLEQLQALIHTSPLKHSDKQDALQETQKIATAAQDRNEENDGVVRKALRYFKGLAGELEEATETAAKIGAVVGSIGAVFGL